MTLGRPPKYSSPEEMQEADDGCVVFSGNDLSTAAFASEKDMQRYFVENAALFAKSFIDDEVVEVVEDHPIKPAVRFGPRGKRMDVVIFGKEGAHIVELKCPRYLKENRNGIGQLLDYGREIKTSSLFLITTRFDISTARTIAQYNLPIRYFYMSKDHTCEYLGDA